MKEENYTNATFVMQLLQTKAIWTNIWQLFMMEKILSNATFVMLVLLQNLRRTINNWLYNINCKTKLEKTHFIRSWRKETLQMCDSFFAEKSNLNEQVYSVHEGKMPF